MTRTISYRWHLRLRMAEAGMFATTDLLPRLADRGVVLSREQVYRLVTGTPERLSLHILAALCDILGCAPGDIVEPVVDTNAGARAKAGGTRAGATAPPAGLRPTRARIVADPPDGS